MTRIFEIRVVPVFLVFFSFKRDIWVIPSTPPHSARLAPHISYCHWIWQNSVILLAKLKKLSNKTKELRTMLQVKSMIDQGRCQLERSSSGRSFYRIRILYNVELSILFNPDSIYLGVSLPLSLDFKVQRAFLRSEIATLAVWGPGHIWIGQDVAPTLKDHASHWQLQETSPWVQTKKKTLGQL